VSGVSCFGKVLSFSGRSRSAGTGALVDVDGSHFLLTAAHCVHFRWLESRPIHVRFSPWREPRRHSWRSGRPDDVVALRMAVPRPWVESGDVQHDFALLRADRFDDLAAADLHTGSLPDRVTLVGIENKLLRAERPRWRSARVTPAGAVPMLSVDAALERGASGGPWTVPVPGGAGEVVSVTSIALRSQPGRLFGPVLSIASLRAAAANLHGAEDPAFATLDLAPARIR